MKAAVEAQMAELRAHQLKGQQARDQLEATSKANAEKLVQALEAEKRDTQRLRKERDQARGDRSQDSRVNPPSPRNPPHDHMLTSYMCCPHVAALRILWQVPR